MNELQSPLDGHRGEERAPATVLAGLDNESDQGLEDQHPMLMLRKVVYLGIPRHVTGLVLVLMSVNYILFDRPLNQSIDYTPEFHRT